MKWAASRNSLACRPRRFINATSRASAIGLRHWLRLPRTTRNAAKTCARAWSPFPKCRNCGAARLQRWRTANRRWKRTIDEAEAPDANEEYLLYQTLLGVWPMEPSGEATKNATPEFIARIQAYMAKALKEAKLNTSWIQPNEQWDTAMHDFIAKVLDPSPRNKFLANFPSGGGRDCATGRDQCTDPNCSEDYRSGRTGYLSRKRNLGL